MKICFFKLKVLPNSDQVTIIYLTALFGWIAVHSTYTAGPLYHYLSTLFCKKRVILYVNNYFSTFPYSDLTKYSVTAIEGKSQIEKKTIVEMQHTSICFCINTLLIKLNGGVKRQFCNKKREPTNFRHT